MKRTGFAGINVWWVMYVCFLLGILAGTAAGNWGNARGEQAGTYRQADESREEMQGEWTAFGGNPWRRAPGSMEKFLWLAKKRLGEGAFAWLLGVTVCSVPCFLVLAVYLGIVFGWMISWYTAELGLLGLPCFWLSCFPQALCYIPAWFLFTWQGLEGKSRIHLVPSFLAALFLCAGAALEAYANPVVWQWFGR